MDSFSSKSPLPIIPLPGRRGCKRSLTNFWRGKARPGESGEVAIRMLLEVRLKLLPPIAVLHGIPKSKIESSRSGLLGCRRSGICGRKRGCIKPCSGKRGKGAFRITLEVGFELGMTAVLDAVPKRELEGDLIVGARFATDTSSRAGNRKACADR